MTDWHTQHEPLGAARGIVVGTVLGLLLWAICLAAVVVVLWR